MAWYEVWVSHEYWKQNLSLKSYTILLLDNHCSCWARLATSLVCLGSVLLAYLRRFPSMASSKIIWLRSKSRLLLVPSLWYFKGQQLDVTMTRIMFSSFSPEISETGILTVPRLQLEESQLKARYLWISPTPRSSGMANSLLLRHCWITSGEKTQHPKLGNTCAAIRNVSIYHSVMSFTCHILRAFS